jgi:hypothetical protein
VETTGGTVRMSALGEALGYSRKHLAALIPTTWRLGVLLLANASGLVTSVASVIAQLEQRGFRLALP